MQGNRISEKLFDSILKIAAEEALEQEMDEMVSCEELNKEYKPSFKLDKKIKRIICRHRIKEKLFVWGKYSSKITVALIIIIVISCTALLSVKATRNYILNAVIRWQEDHFSIQYDSNDDNNYNLIIFRPTYVPAGFNEVSVNVIGDIIRITYENENEQVITLKQSPSEASHILADDEDKSFIETEINGNKAYVFSAIGEDNNNVIWEYDGILFNITSELESDEIIMMGESIIQ